VARKTLMEAKLAGERARRLAAEPSPKLEPISFAPVVVTGLNRKPVLVLRTGEIEIDVLDPRAIDPVWLARVIEATTERDG
jgi:hypothetical protein